MAGITPQLLSARTAFIISASATVFVFFITGSTEYKNLLLVLSFFIVLFLLSFLIIRYTTQRFVHEKLSLIYQTMHQLKKEQGVVEGNINNPISVEGVEEEVRDWYLDNKKEVDRLNLLERYRREFIGNVSHELKTPVFNIQGYLLTLLEGGLEDDKINRKYLERAEKSVEKLIKLLQELDMIIRLDTGGLQLNKQPVDIVSIVKDVVESVEIKAEKKEVKLVINRKNFEPLWVVADEDKISQVISNLLMNSIKYGKAGGKTEVSFHDLKDQILVEIKDNGIGMKPSDLSRIFDRFFRTEEGRRVDNKGFGLGLSIVKHIVEAHKETIHVNSTEGSGSTFSFTLRKAGKR